VLRPDLVEQRELHHSVFPTLTLFLSAFTSLRAAA
jgi:hypothetical protein